MSTLVQNEVSAVLGALCIKLHKNVWAERQYLFELPIITSRLTRAHLYVCAAGRAAAVCSSESREGPAASFSLWTMVRNS
jgi:hypothetical protein